MGELAAVARRICERAKARLSQAVCVNDYWFSKMFDRLTVRAWQLAKVPWAVIAVASQHSVEECLLESTS